MKRVPAVGQELVLARRARGQAEEIDRRISESLAYLANAPDEVEPDLLLLGMLRSQRSRHLNSAEAELTYLQQALAAFNGVDAASAAQGRTKVLLEQISVETDAVFLRTKLHELVSLLEKIRDS